MGVARLPGERVSSEGGGGRSDQEIITVGSGRLRGFFETLMAQTP